MSTLAELLSVMKGKSLTLGWGAIVVYGRDKANALLLEQTIERLQSTDSYIQPISGELYLEDIVRTRMYLHGLQLSAPILSFEAARRRSQGATLRFPVEGGMVVTAIAPAGSFERVVRLEQQLPLAQATLSMHLDLRRTTGGSNAGSVFIELHEGTEITTSFGYDDATRKAVAAFFEKKFQDLDSTRRRFDLGSIGKEEVPELTPETFDLRTATRGDGAQPGSPDYGDGAIELYVRFKGGPAGDAPGPSFPYLLPDGFSGSLVLSSRVLFDKVLKPQLLRDIGYGIGFADYAGGKDTAWVLKANAGEFAAPFDYHYTVRNGDFDAVFSSDMKTTFGPEGSHPPLTVSTDGSLLSVYWKKTTSTPFARVIHWDWPSGDEWDYGNLNLSYEFYLAFSAQLMSDGVVGFFPHMTSSNSLIVSGHDWLPDLGAGHQSRINEVAKEHFLPVVLKMFEGVKPPAVDTFITRNLLFPGRNALLPNRVFLPGDLLLVGEVQQPFVVQPAEAMLAAGGSLVFTTHPAQSGITWSLAGVRGQQDGFGSIDSGGRYTAPAANTLVQGFISVVVTASKGAGSAKTTASTLVHVVRETVAVSPLFQVCDAGASQIFSASALGAGTLRAVLDNPGNGGSLTADGHNQWRYTAGPRDPREYFVLDPVTLTDSASGASKKNFILVIHDVLTLRIQLDEPSPGQGGQLRAFVGPTEVPAAQVEWKVIGDGRVDAGGRYSPPASGIAGFDLITGLTGKSEFIPPSGYLVIPRTAAFPKGLQARRDPSFTIYVSWDAVLGAVEYEAWGFQRKTTTTALKCTWWFAVVGIGSISLKWRYADGQWSEATVIRFANMPEAKRE
ncbi:hypothetical protein [Pseudomonas sp. Marseille-P9899]|uniref:hypothetical protein n=1 Tax=Pseudomonas sp. Marseille-P9899 TaxID=2730401 RepID=UPI00158B72A8|nr:hypothetical protein [Pseudomonas sp. Marseille-P9899]